MEWSGLDRSIRIITDMQNKKKVYLIISIVSFSIVLAALAAIGGLLLAYKRQRDNYEQLAAAARTDAPAAPTTPATEAVEETQPVETEPPLPTVEIPINFDYLKGENEDIIGWIVVDGTLIDYPILYDTTYNYYYLNHNYEGTSTGYGSIFVLGENAGDFTDFNTVVYGHNMLDGRMFAQLHRFRDKNFFDSHGQIIVYTPERQLTYQVFAAYRRDNLDIIANTDFSTKALIDEYIESVYAQTDLAQFNPALEVTSSDRIITLSTCIGNPAYRFVVQGVLVDEAQAVFAGTPDADGE